MGAFQHNHRRIGSGPRHLAWLGIVALLLAGVSPVHAEDTTRPGRGPESAEASAEALEAAVSTSPEDARAGLSNEDTLPVGRPALRRPVLTRAAARERVERMSPLVWLAGFGEVEIDRTTAPRAPTP